MSTTVKAIVESAYSAASIIGESQVLTGAKEMLGLNFFNEILYNYNLENYFPWARRVVDVTAPGTNVIVLAPDPDYVIPPDADCRKFDTPLLVQAEVPMRVNKIEYRSGIQWVPLYQTGFCDLQSYIIRAKTVPNIYAYERDTDHGTVYLDRPSTRNLRMTFNRLLPTYKLTDTFDVPLEYEQLLRYALTAKLVKKYKCPSEDIAVWVDERDGILNGIMERNKRDFSFTYDDSLGAGSWMNIIAPRQWS